MKITLDKDCLILDTVYANGARIDIDDEIAARLIELGHAHLQRPLPPPDKKPDATVDVPASTEGV